MEVTILTDQNVEKDEPVMLTSPKDPTPMETVFLSNIDQTVAFPVETIFFYKVPPRKKTSELDVYERVKKSVSELLLIPYYFMAGRLNFNLQTNRLELLCNNAGVLLVGARSSLRLKDLGNVSLPNPSFKLLIHRTGGYRNLIETPLMTIQVTKFKCGSFSIGFVTNHSILDGKSAIEMFQNLASICRGEGLKTMFLCNDRTCFKARNPIQITYPHKEYTKLEERSSSSSFTSPDQLSLSPLLELSDNHDYRLFSFAQEILNRLKHKAMTKCSSFEAIVAHIWKTRTKAVFEDPTKMSSVLFAVDIRSKITPPLPHGFTGNAVITACASAKVMDLADKPFSFCVAMVKEAIDKVTEDYVRSVIDWLEVYKGVPSASNGNFYVSAWWKLPFHELDFGFGKPLYGGPVVSGMEEFVLLLSDGKSMGTGGGLNVWIALEKERMKRFMIHVFEM